MANVKVAVRVRPLNSRETEDGRRIAVQVEDKVVRVRNVKLDGRLDGRAETPGDCRERILEFGFDYCYWSVNPEAPNYASQEEVFRDLGMYVLAGANEGYNVCLFAYGQTGSGKTYTMIGNPGSIGLTPRIFQELFRSSLDSPDGQNCRIEVSFLEIYNERVRDLLRRVDQKKPTALRVREHPEKGPYVQGLTQHVVEDYKQAADLLEEGIANRITAATHVHDASSRSHAIFSIQYTQAILENNLPSEIVSKINLVDLAGSERADPNYCRDRITEGANINKSLVTLGIVISALAQNSQMCSSTQSINSMLSEGEASTMGSQSSSLSSSSRRHCFIPYRDSVLTWLLKDSLGGNSKTIMIATISPSCISYNETLSTLRYAAHAKNIVNKPRVNEDASVRLIRELREEIDRLKSMLLSFSMQRNPSPSLSDERDSNISDIVLQNELKVEQLTKDWSESWQDKRALLDQYSVDINQDRAGVQIHSLQPHLISLEPDVLSTGVTIYHLREGTTRIGPLDPNKEEPPIAMPEGSVCEIENHNGVVTLKPLPHTACTVNNRGVTEPCRLAQGAVITLAGCRKFRFNHPAEAAVLRERRRVIESVSLFSSSESNVLPFNSRAEQVGSQESSERFAPWQRLEEHQRYVECLREEILLEQRRAEKDLEREQAHLRKQRSDIQQWLLQEKQRLIALSEWGMLDSGVQTEFIPLPALTDMSKNETICESMCSSQIMGNQKRVVQEELLKHHALRRNENRIRRKRLRYQLERIARKRHLLEAKQELQRLETALSLGDDGHLSPDLGSPSKRRGHPVVLRRHSFSVELLSRLYPQHTSMFSQFLRRNRLSESTSSLSRVTLPRRWVSDECLPDKPRCRSNTMPSSCCQGTSSRTSSSENMRILLKENTLTEAMTETPDRASQLQSSVNNHTISAIKSTVESENGDGKKVLPIIKQSRPQKTSPKDGKCSSQEGNKGLETIRKAFSRSVGFGIKMALSRVFRKPPLGSRGGKGAKSASRARMQFAAEIKKDNVLEDKGTKHQKFRIKQAMSCDGLDKVNPLKEQNHGQWHSAETLTKKSRRWGKTQEDLTNWVENNSEKVTDDSSDCDSLFSVDSLSSAYAIALAEQLQQEDCEPSEPDSEDSQMSKDSLVKENGGDTDTKPTLKLSHSLCHTLHSSSSLQATVGRNKEEKSKEMSEELFQSLHGQKVTRQVIQESSDFTEVMPDPRQSSDVNVKETEAFLALTDAWSSTDAADSPRITGASETLLKRCRLSESRSSQSQAGLDPSGETTASECQTSASFDFTPDNGITVKEQSQVSSESETVLDYFLNELTSTSSSAPECTLLQENNTLLGNFEVITTSGEASNTQNTVSNSILCTNTPPSPELAPLEVNDGDMQVDRTHSKESAGRSSPLICVSDKSPDKDLKSNSTSQTEFIPSGNKSVQTTGFTPHTGFIEAKQEPQSKESCIVETTFRNSDVFSKSDGHECLEIHHAHGILQPGNELISSNNHKLICCSREYQSTVHDFQCEPQCITEHLVNHIKKEVNEEKSLVQNRVQCTEKRSDSYDAGDLKDYPFEMKLDSEDETVNSKRHCDAQLEHESCSAHSRKRSKGSQDDFTESLKTPKRSCVESLDLGDSAPGNVLLLFNENSNISRDCQGKPLPTEKELISMYKQTFKEVHESPGMDNYVPMCIKNSQSLVASYISEDRTASTVTKEQKISTIFMNKCESGVQDVKFPNVEVVDKEVFESSTLQKVDLTINNKISEVVKEHLSMSLQVDGGEDSNQQLETNNTTPSASKPDILMNTESKNDITAEVSQGDLGFSHSFRCANKYSTDDGVNVNNSAGCLSEKFPVQKEVVLARGVGFPSNCPSLSGKNFSEEIKHLDNHDAYGPVPQDLKIKFPEANTVLREEPADDLELLNTSPSDVIIDGVTCNINKSIQLKLMSTCKQSPEVSSSSEYVFVTEEHEFLIKAEPLPINKVSGTGTSVRANDNGLDLLSYAQQMPGVYPEDKSVPGVSKDVCDVIWSNRSSQIAMDHTVTAKHWQEVAESVEASKVNMPAEIQEMVELHTAAHLDSKSTIQWQEKNERSYNSDRDENIQATYCKPLKKPAYQECDGEKDGFIAQEQFHNGNETKDKVMDVESHPYSRKLHNEDTISKSCQALVSSTSTLLTDHETQMIKNVIMRENPLNSLQIQDHKDDQISGKKIQQQCFNVQKENKHSNKVQFQDLSILSKSVGRPEQVDLSEANKPELTFSAPNSLNPKEPQVKGESSEKGKDRKKQIMINDSRLVFSRSNEEQQRVKPKRYRKAHFTAPLSSSTDSTPDSSLNELAKSRPHKCGGGSTPVILGTPPPGRFDTEKGNISSDESSTATSLEISPGSVGSKSTHGQSSGTDCDNLNPYIRDVTTDLAKELWQKKYLAAKLFKTSGLSKNNATIHLIRKKPTKHTSEEKNRERAGLSENDSIQIREPVLHFGSSDINPFIYTRNKDQLQVGNNNQAFGSAVNISGPLSSLKSSNSGIARCCSMDYGLNVQSAPFSSHLSTYAVQKELSSTLSSGEGSREHISTESKLMEAFCPPPARNEKVLTVVGSDSCNDPLELASSSGQVDEIVLVYSSEHEIKESKQDFKKCHHGTQTVKFYDDTEKKKKHKRSSTQVPVSRQMHGTSTTWTSLQNMSEHLSELIVSTSDLLGSIQCMRTGESSMKNGPPLKTAIKDSKVLSDKYYKNNGATQTAIDAGVQTEDSALLMKQNKVLQSTPPTQNPKSHEVNVIVKVIGSKICRLPEKNGVTKAIKDEDERNQTLEEVKSLPDLHPGGLPSSEQLGRCRKFDTQSLGTISTNPHCPVAADHKAYTFAVCTPRKCSSQMMAKDNLTHQQMRTKTKASPDNRVLLIDRASSPILTVDVTSLQKRKIKHGTIHTSTESLSKLIRNPHENNPETNNKPKSQHQRNHYNICHTENQTVSSISIENLSNPGCIHIGAPDVYSTDVSSNSHMQNGRIENSHEMQSKATNQAPWCSRLSHSHSSVKHGQRLDLSQSTLQSSTPINPSHRSSIQENKHKFYKDVSCWSELSKDAVQYQEEDSMSLALSECNTDFLVSIDPLTESGQLQGGPWIPENLPMHNKFTNWSGISQLPPAKLFTNENSTMVEKSKVISTQGSHLHSAESDILGCRYNPELLQTADRRTREIERLRKEREQILASMDLDLSPQPLTVEPTEAKLQYGLKKTDTLLKMVKSSPRAESVIPTKQQLYDRHRRSIDGLRKEREDCLQPSRRARSLSPGKQPNSLNHMTDQSQRNVALPSRRQEYFKKLRKEVVEMSRVPDPPRGTGQYPTDIEFLLRDYSRAREEAKMEIARARVRLRERVEKEKLRLEQQALTQSVKDHQRLCTPVSNSTWCTGSNLSLSSGPTSGYNSSNTALLKDVTLASIPITKVSDKDLKVRSRPPVVLPQSLKASCTWSSAQDIRLESSSSGYEHQASCPSSPGRQRTCSFSSPSSISISYQDIAECTLTSAISEVHLASGGDVRNLLTGQVEAGWRHQGLENGVQTFYRPFSTPSAHGFLGAMELERPLASLWSLIQDHSRIHLYNKSLKTAWTRLLDDTTQLVYLLTDPSNCYMKQPRDFCCLSTESKRDDKWVLAMQSVFDESLPRPNKDTVRGEMFPSAWILQRREQQGREIVTVIYLLQVDLGTPTLPQRLLNVVGRKQAAVIADLQTFLSS